ncbi:helix-turn-helix domain-containing protein [Candidatus Azoamicus ciliaticola]|uniref:Chromosomal replication initiator protein DnaA n=1 Tax=Candidatus Azoamicus ciliaticola TaxID=2652803 RepID=A0A6J5JVE2_9GAMM|nr:helix-turn-helix domain-containing protein [Candidatus Azoamicus ciliaticola]CAB3976258.1 Chromosomal replication initiator protein DnaA [Candidatus Azoamicus ciliaticola]
MNKKIKNIFWQTCTKYLQNTIPMKNFIEYICPLQAYIEEKTLILLSPNNYIKEKIEKNYLSIIKNVIQNISDDNYKIKIIIGSIKQIKQTKQNIEKNRKNELKNVNNFAKSAIFMTIKNPGILYNPIYIYEEKNTNKNNIINFIINNLTNSNKNVKYTIIKNDIINLENLFKNNKLLIIEEINLIKINLKSQQILQKTLELIIKNNIQLIITANENFNKLKNINKNTKKLIENGLIIKIIKNEKYTKIKKQISIDNIIKNTLAYYNMDIEKIKNKKRQKNIVLVRQIIFYLCKTLTNKTFSELSPLLGEYTNSNIMYSYKKIKILIEKDINIKNDIQNIKNNIIK